MNTKQFTNKVGLQIITTLKRKLTRCLKPSLLIIMLVGVAASLGGCQMHMVGMLNPKGVVAQQERELFFDSLALMLIVVIPVIVMSFAFSFRYRASHKTSEYKPNWSHNYYLEALWWAIPCIIVVILGILTWKKTHQLDPYRKMDVPGKPLLIEAVSLEWKWLFIYPEQNIATVNYVKIPKGRQVEFWITSDAPMSAFFIPQLGSQIFSMAGMRTRLHLLATHNGTYEGLNTQYNGAGFADMHFKANVLDQKDFNSWAMKVRASASGTSGALTIPAYKKLVKPTINAPAQTYSSVQPNLFKRIMMQYMMPNMRLH